MRLLMSLNGALLLIWSDRALLWRWMLRQRLKRQRRRQMPRGIVCCSLRRQRAHFQTQLQGSRGRVPVIVYMPRVGGTEERSVGKEWVRTCRSGGATYN